MGFAFNGRHTDAFDIGVKHMMRVVKPEKRVFKTIIGGRDGTTDFTDNTYDNIIISFECDYKGTDFDEAKNDMALWLSNSGELVLDDEPGKIYQANLYTEISLSQMLHVREFTLQFECFPFAMSLPHQRNNVITRHGQETAFQVGGTARTPCTVILRNIGSTPITNLRLTHRKEV
jgi:predicted phage tail component-like protein